MTSELDDLQQFVNQDINNTYSKTVIDHAMHPRNVGSIPDYDGYASVTGPCGDTMQIWLRVQNNHITQTAFWTDGCSTSIASGSMVTEMASGKIVMEALRISQVNVLNALGGLPEDSEHCALLAANTLKEAIKDYLVIQKEPWKKAYRKH